MSFADGVSWNNPSASGRSSCLTASIQNEAVYVIANSESLAVPTYQVSYETSWGRCAWCWNELPRAETHTVVTALSPPLLMLHLHHACFDTYRYTSGLDLAAVGSSKDWPPSALNGCGSLWAGIYAGLPAPWA